MSSKYNGLFILRQQIDNLIRKKEKNDPNKKESLKVARERAKATTLTLFAVSVISLSEKDLIDTYINQVYDGEVREDIKYRTIKLFEEMMKESEVC